MVHNLHTVAMSADILCVRCVGCAHRAALGKDVLPIHRGNMTELRALKFRCNGCGVRGGGLKEFALYIPYDLQEAKDFLAGHDVERCRARI
jgi:hypothetical protein